MKLAISRRLSRLWFTCGTCSTAGTVKSIGVIFTGSWFQALEILFDYKLQPPSFITVDADFVAFRPPSRLIAGQKHNYLAGLKANGGRLPNRAKLQAVNQDPVGTSPKLNAVLQCLDLDQLGQFRPRQAQAQGISAYPQFHAVWQPERLVRCQSQTHPARQCNYLGSRLPTRRW
jgi:hypothetical protein